MQDLEFYEFLQKLEVLCNNFNIENYTQQQKEYILKKIKKEMIK